MLFISASLRAQDTLVNSDSDTSSSASIDTDSAIIHQNMDEIYESAKRSFGNIKGAKIGSKDGKTIYASKLELLQATECTIEVDSERSHTYIAKYTGLDLEEAKSLQEKLTVIIYKRTQPEGFKRAKGSNFKYYKYQMNTVEFESDNIDEMGKHPSFSIGVLAEADGNFTLIYSATDPLWK